MGRCTVVESQMSSSGSLWTVAMCAAIGLALALRLPVPPGGWH